MIGDPTKWPDLTAQVPSGPLPILTANAEIDGDSIVITLDGEHGQVGITGPRLSVQQLVTAVYSAVLRL